MVKKSGKSGTKRAAPPSTRATSTAKGRAAAKPVATKAAAKPAAKRASKAAAKDNAATPAAAPNPQLDVFIAAAAHALALPLEPAWLPAIRTNLDVTLRQAALVTEFALPDDAEPAPVFEA